LSSLHIYHHLFFFCFGSLCVVSLVVPGGTLVLTYEHGSGFFSASQFVPSKRHGDVRVLAFCFEEPFGEG
jgi:hypothetical protein